uniref:hypothetical protein n=1 Tax=Sphingomonas sp. TaxID=28214 RepID=UPI0025E56BC6|nr:hypothetical protein [Sphingomonas sp.]
MRQLQDYFERIEASMAAGDTLLARRDPSQTETIKAKCTEAALLIGSYHMFVHREVFEPLMSTPDERIRNHVVTLKTECIALTEDLRVGVKAMAVPDAPFDYDAVCARVEWYNGRVRKHIVAIRQLLDAPCGIVLRAA